MKIEKIGVTVRIILNGKETEVEKGTTIQQLLMRLKVEPQMVACELNSKIVRRKEYSDIQVSDNDRVEILQMIGGG